MTTVFNSDTGHVEYSTCPRTQSPFTPGMFASHLCFSALIPYPCFFGITAAVLDPVTTMLVNVQTYANPTILLGLSPQSDLLSPKLSHCITQY